MKIEKQNNQYTRMKSFYNYYQSEFEKVQQLASRIPWKP